MCLLSKTHLISYIRKWGWRPPCPPPVCPWFGIELRFDWALWQLFSKSNYLLISLSSLPASLFLGENVLRMHPCKRLAKPWQVFKMDNRTSAPTSMIGRFQINWKSSSLSTFRQMVSHNKYRVWPKDNGNFILPQATGCHNERVYLEARV